jgi:hypothetical protein
MRQPSEIRQNLVAAALIVGMAAVLAAAAYATGGIDAITIDPNPFAQSAPSPVTSVPVKIELENVKATTGRVKPDRVWQ